MKVTINELMRIRKEIAGAIVSERQKLQYNVTYGRRFEDGVDVTETDKDNFIDVINKLSELNGVSEIISSVLDDFNLKNQIPALVRNIKNVTFTKDACSEALNKLNQSNSEKFMNMANGDRKLVLHSFIPYIVKQDFNEEYIKTRQTIIRKLQGELDKLNVTEVEIPYTYEDLDRMISD